MHQRVEPRPGFPIGEDPCRHARPEIFRAYRDEISAAGKHAAEILRNFRSREPVLRTVEALLNSAEGIDARELLATRIFHEKPEPSIEVLRVLSSDGGRIVKGRSRGAGKRSRPRVEPVIMGEARGAGAIRRRGGRPPNDSHQTLVMHLALDWLIATGGPPKSGRSDNTAFGDLVYSVFQWLGFSEKAAYALRRYWTAVRY